MSLLIPRFGASLLRLVAKQSQIGVRGWGPQGPRLLGASGTTTAAAAAATTSVQQQLLQLRSFSDVDGPKKRISKVKKKVKKSSEPTGRSRDLELLLAFLDAPRVKPPPPADGAEADRRETVRKNHVAGKFRQHNEENHDISCKLRMKRHAVAMLPKGTALREKALSVDDGEYPPRWRTIPAWTPPIPGFNPSDYLVTEE